MPSIWSAYFSNKKKLDNIWSSIFLADHLVDAHLLEDAGGWLLRAAGVMEDNIVIYRKYTQFTLTLVLFHNLYQIVSLGVVRG